MSKIYILVAGEFSDFHIEGVYETMEEAERYRKLFNHYACADIMEWEIGAKPVTSLKGMVSVWDIYQYDGHEPRVREIGMEQGALVGGVLFCPGDPWQGESGIIYSYKCTISKEIAPDKEHALKIFYDQVSEFKAKRDGIV